MGELYTLRTRENPPLSGAEAMQITNAAYSMPKKAFNERLEIALEELKGREGISDYRARIMVCGSYMDDTFLIGLIEDTGALVVTDNLCFGRRHIEGLVEDNGDPLVAIAKRYFHHNPCPRMLGTYKQRLEFTKNIAAEAGVDGIIFQSIPFCDTHGAESPMQASDLEEIDMPTLILDREYIPSDQGRLKTRIQAFLEKMGK
jgi:benzoyl-CoA reductase/2-hydroxyglutaryl-CoA dehydratase subunit BcrC/BadD/HgdB